MASAQQSSITNATTLSTLWPSSALSSAEPSQATRLSNGTKLQVVITLLIILGNLSCCRWTSNRKWHSHNRKTQFTAIQNMVQHLEEVMTLWSLINAILLTMVILFSPIHITLRLSLMQIVRRVGVLLVEQQKEINLRWWSTKCSKCNWCEIRRNDPWLKQIKNNQIKCIYYTFRSISTC